MTLIFNKTFDTNYNLLNNLLPRNLKVVPLINAILNNRLYEMFLMVIIMVALMFVGRRLLIILKGSAKNED